MLKFADMSDNASIEIHYQLLLGLMRIINSVVLSRGEQNEQTLAQGRRFLSENRLSVLTVFKRSMSIGAADRAVSTEVVNDLADSYTLLITLTGFINVSVHSQAPKTDSNWSYSLRTKMIPKHHPWHLHNISLC